MMLCGLPKIEGFWPGLIVLPKKNTQPIMSSEIVFSVVPVYGCLIGIINSMCKGIEKPR